MSEVSGNVHLGDMLTGDVGTRLVHEDDRIRIWELSL